METPKKQLILGEMLVGSRLILRCKKDWREAVISHFYNEKAVLSVGSASGKTYRVRRPVDAQLFIEGGIPVLPEDCGELGWRENFLKYDWRW